MQKVLITKEGDANEGKQGIADVYSDSIIVFVDFGGKPKIYSPFDIKTGGRVFVWQATLLAFNQQKDIFNILELVRSVRLICSRPYLMDGTILRRLRELRDDKRINYEVIDTLHAKYKKLWPK